MRFLANGPSIPNDLLVARDEGRVVFFCGAGVSRARAGLADFFGLAKDVVETLGVKSDDPARVIIEAAKEINRSTGISGLISADRIFGLLERNFLIQDIYAAVAQALKPGPEVDLSAHRIMLDLARTPDGKVRLVTTNFDLLFEECDKSLPYSSPARLPEVSRHKTFDGIVHLHGHVNAAYSGAAEEGFILSSSEFGRAYLSEGWATAFIQAILEKYIVVFVGYTADDPPVQYLLEALNRYSKSIGGIYAFQSGAADEASAKWLHKGVQPIAYYEDEKHAALWETLDAWATRARAPEAWYDHVVEMARKGPEVLLPHERGQVAHIVTTIEGVKKFAWATPPVPAEWLCVFDPYIRYSKPGRIGSYHDDSPQHFDPFEAYGLDSDTTPPKIEPDDLYAKREMYKDAWNGFEATRLDRQNLQEEDYSALRGHWSINPPKLPARLGILGVWIGTVSNQPATVWWAAGQIGLHPDIQDRIRFESEHSTVTYLPAVRQAWGYLFETWKLNRKEHSSEQYRIKAAVDRYEWTNGLRREFASINRPYLKVERPSFEWRRPPDFKEDVHLKSMVRIEVEYPKESDEVSVPNEDLQNIVPEFRKNLEHAVSLEEEIGGYGLYQLCSIEPATTESISTRDFGIAHAFLFYVDLLKRLEEFDSQACRNEFLSWAINDDAIFTRLKIWACGRRKLTSDAEAGKFFFGLSDEIFWASDHQRDLLLAMVERWPTLPEGHRKRIEQRLLRGRSKWEGEKKKEHINWRASLSLTRIHWLHAHGCQFNFDLDVESKKLREFCPDWREEYAERAVDSMDSQGGWVQKNTDYSDLIIEPLGAILAKAAATGGRIHGLIENAPFGGLVSARPVRAMSALSNAARRAEYPDWAWRAFLNAEARKSDKPRLCKVIAGRILAMPVDSLTPLIRPVSDWLLNSASVLPAASPELIHKVFARLIDFLSTHPDAGKSSMVRGSKEPEWATEALNAPVGKLAQVLMQDPTKEDPQHDQGFLTSWIDRVEDLLALKDDLHRHALVMFMFNLNWFYAVNPEWTERNLISVFDHEGDDQNAAWAGFFWGAKIPQQGLYSQIKPHLLRLARTKLISRHSYTQVLSGVLVGGWGSKIDGTNERCVTTVEMRDALIEAEDEFRTASVWQLTRWSKDDAEWRARLPDFFKYVWPRQKKAKSPAVSAAICNLAFSHVDTFGSIIDIILPLLAGIERAHIGLHSITGEKKKIVQRYPEKVLALLFAILPETVSGWPYGIENVLDQIAEVESSLLKDDRLIELKRRWNAR